MTTIDIHIPKPVLTVEVDYDPEGFGFGNSARGGEHVAKIRAGGILLHEERFTSQYDWNPDAASRRPHNYVDNADQAGDKAIANFGKRLLALLNGETK